MPDASQRDDTQSRGAVAPSTEQSRSCRGPSSASLSCAPPNPLRPPQDPLRTPSGPPQDPLRTPSGPPHAPSSHTHPFNSHARPLHSHARPLHSHAQHTRPSLEFARSPLAFKRLPLEFTCSTRSSLEFARSPLAFARSPLEFALPFSRPQTLNVLWLVLALLWAFTELSLYDSYFPDGPSALTASQERMDALHLALVASRSPDPKDRSLALDALAGDALAGAAAVTRPLAPPAKR
eukprot:1182888-Prorocentrum_minimum.AAC.1